MPANVLSKVLRCAVLHRVSVAEPAVFTHWLPVVAGILHAGGGASAQCSGKLEGTLVQAHSAFIPDHLYLGAEGKRLGGPRCQMPKEPAALCGP